MIYSSKPNILIGDIINDFEYYKEDQEQDELVISVSRINKIISYDKVYVLLDFIKTDCDSYVLLQDQSKFVLVIIQQIPDDKLKQEITRSIIEGK